jgi:hypothetical protein
MSHDDDDAPGGERGGKDPRDYWDEDGNPRGAAPSLGGNEKAGYRNPPQATRFKPGQSGNPSGKRRSEGYVPRSLEDIVRTQLNAPMPIKINGDIVTVVAIEAIIMSFIQKAPSDPRYARMLLDLISRRGMTFGSRPMNQQELTASMTPEDIQEIQAIARELDEIATREYGDVQRGDASEASKDGGDGGDDDDDHPVW